MKLLDLIKRNGIIVALVTGLCLILKVWAIRRWFKMEVNVLDLYIPTLLLAAYGPVRAIMLNKKKPSRIRWDGPLLWTVLIILATALSTYMYVR